jgi:hypothetical protein
MEEKQKLFAFKLAAKEQRDAPSQPRKWQARDGVSLAGCSDPSHEGDFREGDRGVWC